MLTIGYCYYLKKINKYGDILTLHLFKAKIHKI